MHTKISPTNRARCHACSKKIPKGEIRLETNTEDTYRNKYYYCQDCGIKHCVIKIKELNELVDELAQED